MTKVYIEKQNAPELTPSLVFWPNFKFEISPKLLFRREIMEQYQTPFFEIVSDISLADFVAVPYDYFLVLQYAPDYLKRSYKLAEESGKKILLFDYTDYADKTAEIPESAILFRVSTYRHHKKKNEIIMPYFVEDMGAKYKITPKERNSVFSVGFCGQSRFASSARALRARVKLLFSQFLFWLRGDAESKAHERGIFWRGRALKILRKGGILVNAVERSFYSLHRASSVFNEIDIRREYAENLRESDLALCARGDSNASQRFYEALSASRVPVFIDTDCVLPLEEIIPYENVLLRVPAEEIKRLPEIIRNWSEKQTAESFLQTEKLAREIFDKYLRLDRYFEIVFDREKSPYREVLYRISKE